MFLTPNCDSKSQNRSKKMRFQPALLQWMLCRKGGDMDCTCCKMRACMSEISKTDASPVEEKARKEAGLQNAHLGASSEERGSHFLWQHGRSLKWLRACLCFSARLLTLTSWQCTSQDAVWGGWWCQVTDTWVENPDWVLGSASAGPSSDSEDN